MDLFIQYKKERAGQDCIATYKGFIFYKIEFPNALIADWFVAPEYRKNGYGYFLADQCFEIFKDAGVKDVFCTTDMNAVNWKIAENAILNFGFKWFKREGSLNHYQMGVDEWAV